MRFDALYFLIFFATVFCLSRFKAIAPVVYLLASVLFYIVAGWQDCLLIISMIVFNYVMSFGVLRHKLVLPCVVSANVGTLVFFKYRIFLDGIVLSQSIFTGDIIIPLGISFYTFQMIAYQVDISRGACQLIRSLPKFFLFIGFFPQLVAGPIVRANQMRMQIDRFFEKGKQKNIIISLGLGLILLGLIKKVMLSDSIAPLVDKSFMSLPETAAAAWQGAILFGFQIYYDFSGYSDIALGLAYLLGFKLPINFRQPYLAKNPQEFWQRWHITLSTWIRDYLYIPLGGSREGSRGRQVTILLLVMGTMGLWHGANITFLYWGIGWGLTIALWRIFGKYLSKAPAVSWGILMVICFTLWVFFRAPDVDFALAYTQTMFSMNVGSLPLTFVVGLVFLSAFHVIEGRFYNQRGVRLMKKINRPFFYGLFIGLCLLILMLPKNLDNPFIYFRF